MKEIDVSNISPASYNPRKISEHAYNGLKNSMDKFGDISGITWNKRTGNLIAGHQRWNKIQNDFKDIYLEHSHDDKHKIISKSRGYVGYDIRVVDWDSSTEKAANVTANNHAIGGEWELETLKELMIEIKDFDPIAFEELNFPELSKSFDFKFEEETNQTQGLTDEDEIPEVVKPITKRGDIWILGGHRLMCGDSTMIDDVEKLMKGEKADMVFTDPPYNQETDGGFKSQIGAALRKQSSEIEHLCNFDPDAFLGILPAVFEKNKLNALVFCNKDLVVDYLKWARDSGYSYNILFWKKPSAIPIGGSYRPDVEYLLVFRKSGIFNGALADVSYSKCLEHSREKNKVHPTMKPVEMIENQLKICSNKGSVVLDFFGGSGSTAIACEITGRKCRLMELSESYCDVIINRWQNFTGKKATLESTGQTYDEVKINLISENVSNFAPEKK